VGDASYIPRHPARLVQRLGGLFDRLAMASCYQVSLGRLQLVAKSCIQDKRGEREGIEVHRKEAGKEVSQERLDVGRVSGHVFR
jgi:hypothetical protein